MNKTCVIGWPIAHSRSPLIHNYWLARLGIDSLYEKIAVAPEELAGFIASLPASGYRGCNVTIPHKERAFELAAVRDPVSSRLGAANTLYVRNGQVCCTSTDGEGFIASLNQSQPGLMLRDASVVMLGAGGAARSIIGALLDAGVASIGVINRTEERVRKLRQDFGDRIRHLQSGEQDGALSACGLLVNTTSLGMHGQPPLELDVAILKDGCLVADIVYVPLQTRLIRDAEKRGLPVAGGLGMLLHQAVRGFELWYGVKPEVTAELRELVEADVRKAAGH